MPGSRRRSLHPLLLEPKYWRNRLRELKLARLSVLLFPRAELSTPAFEVDEFRIRAHDGVRLLGLRAQSRLGAGTKPARIRLVGPCDVLQIDRATLEDGSTEYILQELPGRRLEDRVLDVLRVCQMASANNGSDLRTVCLVSPEHEPDEFLIASQLLADEIEAPELDLDPS